MAELSYLTAVTWCTLADNTWDNQNCTKELSNQEEWERIIWREQFYQAAENVRTEVSINVWRGVRKLSQVELIHLKRLNIWNTPG